MTANVEWTREMLMGTSNGHHEEPKEDGSKLQRRRSSKKKQPLDMTVTDTTIWGIPGHLTQEETEVYFKFKEEITKRGGEFVKTVYSFGEEEEEPYALTRWLRARKFVYDDVIKMVEEATECRASAREHDFYPDPAEALGCEDCLFFAQYPQLYSGVAKNGAPLFISKPGVLNVDGIECITTLEGIIRLHWYVMVHDFARRLRDQKEKDPDFHRFECVCVLDLANLTSAQLTSKALTIVKEQSFIDSLCFPETMSKMVIVNAPRFFGVTWRLIKGWIDARTANKIDVTTDKASGEKKLLELVDAEHLPSDYGGKGPDTNETLMKSGYGGCTRLITKVMYLRHHGSHTFEVNEGEHLEVTIYTRSPAGAKVSLTDAKHIRKDPWVDGRDVKHEGSGDLSETPSKAVITDARIPGPAHVKVKMDSHAGRFTTNNFLIAFKVFPTAT